MSNGKPFTINPNSYQLDGTVSLSRRSMNTSAHSPPPQRIPSASTEEISSASISWSESGVMSGIQSHVCPKLAVTASMR